MIKEESEKLVNSADLADAAIKRAENTGIIFIDEIDKIASKSQQNAGQVSREGVQRDILPIVEGSQISTDRSSNSTRIGKRPCNSAIKSLGLLSWKAPEPMNKMWSVLTKPYLVEI